MTAAVGREKKSLEVLVATMHQNDWSLIDRMHLEADAVVANQCGRWDYEEKETIHGRIRMISTATVGVGVNRNLALELSEAEILLFADDDIEYYDGALQAVEDAFRHLPDADVIAFGIDMTRNGEIYDSQRESTKRRHLWNSLKYGTCRLAVRRESILRKRIRFSPYFGGGSIYGGGEDTIFICDCLRAGLKIYSHEVVLGRSASDSSTWFNGYDSKYFFDRGALFACALPEIRHLIKWYFAARLAARQDISLGTVIRWMNRGMRAYKKLQGYDSDGSKEKKP